MNGIFNADGPIFRVLARIADLIILSILWTVTSIPVLQSDNGSVDEYQTQCAAIGDGVDYEKYAGNPVLDVHDLPEGSNISNFRDPKIWRDTDGTYRCAAANRAADGSGQILLFSSRDALRWQFKGVLLKNENRFGEMWECPDLFEADGADVPAA